MAEDRADETKELGHEPTTVSVRSVAVAMAVLLSVVAAALLLIAALVWYFAGAEGRRATVALPEVESPGLPGVPPPEVLDVTLLQLRALENETLTEYAWVDQEEAVARIPIERAIEIMAERQSVSLGRSDEDQENNP